jgi:hypothetical protein
MTLSWQRKHETELLSLWSLLGSQLRARTTPEDFRNWVYAYSVGPEDLAEESLEESLDGDWSSDAHLLEQAEERYVAMYTWCEQSWLPLLSHHQGALPALQELCFLDDGGEDLESAPAFVTVPGCDA